MPTRLLLVLMGAVLFSGAATAGKPIVNVREFKPGNTVLDKHDIVYALPKTVLKLKITYTVLEEVQRFGGFSVVALPKKVLVEKPVELEVLTRPDPDNQYIISGKAATGSLFDEAKVGFVMGSDGVLGGINANAQDQTLKAATQLLAFVARVATFRTNAHELHMKGEQPAKSPAEKRQACKAELYKRLDLTKEDDALMDSFLDLLGAYGRKLDESVLEAARTDIDLDAKVRRMKAIHKELSAMNGTVDAFLMAHELYKKTDYVAAVYLDSKDFAPTQLEQKELVATVTPTSNMFPPDTLKGIDPSTLPTMTVEVEIPASRFGCSHNYFAEGSTAAGACTPKEETPQTEGGVVYRRTEYAPVRVCTADRRQTNRVYVAFPQFSPHAVAEVTKKSFTKRNNKLIFDRTTGRLTEYEVETGAPAADVTAILNSAAKEQEEIRAAAVQRSLNEVELAEALASPSPSARLTGQFSSINELLKEWDAFRTRLDAIWKLPVFAP